MVTVDLRYVQTKSDRDKGHQGAMGAMGGMGGGAGGAGGAGGGGYYRPAKVERWADSLMSLVSDNFEVQCFKVNGFILYIIIVNMICYMVY